MVGDKKKWYQKSRSYRYITLGLVFLFMLYVFLRQILFYDKNVEEYCPFGGLETLYSYITAKEFIVQVGITNLVLFVLIVIITLIFRGGFCSWICPLGTAQDIIRYIGKKIGNLPFLKPINKKYGDLLKNNKDELHSLDHQMRYLKYFFLVFAILGTYSSATLLIRQYDTVIALIKILTFQVTIGLFILIFITILSFFIDRPFCKYLCLMGATINIIGKVSPLRITRNENLCTNCNLCTKSCPMNLDISAQKNINSLDCNHCFNCIDACPNDGTLVLKYFPKDLYNISEKTKSLKKLGSDTNE